MALNFINKKLIYLFLFLFISWFPLYAQDTDSDGIVNSVDIDDDNDGIPDVFEDICNPLLSPTNTGIKGENRVPTGWSIVTSSPDIVDIAGSTYGAWSIGCTSAAPAAPNGHTKWVFISSPTSETFRTTITNMVVGKTYTFTYHCGRFGGFGFTAGQITVRLGSATIDLYTPSSGCGWDTRVVTFTASAASQEISFAATGTGNSCANISVSSDAVKSDCDFDGDGIVNSQDLDSDNDGCSDAFEGGATTSTTTNFSFSGTVGTNGLIDLKETVADNGLLNYTLNYDYVIDSTIKACTDTDGDGIFDLSDIDDDNDGIKDVDEGYYCVSSFTNCQIFTEPVLTSANLVVNGDFENGTNGFSTTYVPGGGLCSQYAISPNGFGPVGGSCSKGNYLSLNADCSPPLTHFWSQTITVKPYTNYKFGYSYAHQNPGTIGFTVNGGAIQGNVNTTGSWSTYQNTIYSGSNTSLTINLFELTGVGSSADFAVDDIYLLEDKPLYCVQNPLDSDNDGIPNYLDLDSDNDGCSDALEGGATSDTTKNFKFTAPFGINGLANSKETAADNGIINYTLTYSLATSASIKGCIDSDGDGVMDISDIDDDNDGIPDVKENCFMSDPSIAATYTRTTGNYALVNGAFNNTKRGTVQITSSAVSGTSGVYGTPNRDIATGDCAGNASADLGVRDVTFSTPVTNAIFLNEGFEFADEYQDIEILAPFSGTPEFKILSNHLNCTLTKISSTRYRIRSGASCGIYANCPSSMVIQISGAFYSKIRLTGDGPTSNSSCRYIKIGLDDAATDACDLDMDNDGIPNELDLDSDGDGCSDALEGGATTDTTKNFKFAAPYGTNGLANSKETVADNGIINYTLTYNNAIDNTIKGCTDTDGDGVFDIVDLDDDNDGILDLNENNCELIINGNFTSNTNGWITNEPISPTYLVSIGAFAFNGGNVLPQGNFIYQNIQTTPNNSYTLTFKAGVNATATVSTTVGIKVDIIDTINNKIIQTKNIFKVGSSATSSIESISFLAESTSTRIRFTDISSGAALSIDPTIDDVSILYCDTDGDGIPNRLDLDSDNDGCSDALEGGATSDTTKNFKFAAPYGTNGLANSKETATDNGIINYTLTYNNAIDNTIKGCTDTDGDGVFDIVDLDDDNDGILDVDENCLLPNKAISSTYTNTSTNYATIPGTNVTKSGNVTISTASVSGTSSVSGNAVSTGNCNGSTPDNGVIDVNFSSPITNAIFRINGVEFIDEFTEIELLPPFTGLPVLNVISSINNGSLVQLSATKYKFVSGCNTGCYSGIIFQLSGAYYSKLRISGGSTSGTTWCRGLTIGLGDAVVQNSCNNDIDGDGIINDLDLDSDNDGCSDALEGGATSDTTKNFKFTSPFGTNGLANSKETATDNGIINYALTYNYAINNTANACADTDGDGVRDLVDIDDDNDGIIDLDECGSTSVIFTENFEGATLNPYNSAAIYQPGVSVNGQLAAGGANGTSKSLYHNTGGGTYTSGDVVWGTRNPITVSPGKVYEISFYMLENGGGNPPQIETWVNNTKIGNAVTITTSWVKYTYLWNSASNNKLDLDLKNLTATGAGNDFRIDEITILDKCIDADTDGDGVSNRLDLDSDNDGCSDAFEGGSTNSTTANFKFTGPFGTNGLANSKETATDNGIINYTLTYNYATNNAIKACVDTDGDGVLDLVDIDDDNDGILDLDECGSTSVIFTENFEGATVNPYNSAAVYQPGVSINGQLAAGGANGTTKSLYHNTGTGTYNVGDIVWGTRNPITVIPAKVYEISFYMLENGGGSPPQIETWINNTKVGNAVTITTSWVKYTYLWNSGANNILNLELKNLTATGAGNDFRIDEIIILDKCIDADTDGDGIPNRLDLDSDNDGCSDAFEAGATKNSSANYKFPGGYGTNGLDNTLETVVDNGIINYTLTYSRATSASIKPCLTPDVSPNNGIDSTNTIKLCQVAGGSRQLTANVVPANSGATLNWYTSATGGTASSTAPTISLSNPTSVSHWVSQTVNGVESPRVEIRVFVSAVPAAPTNISGPTQIATNGVSTHSISPVTGATGYVWTLPSGFKGFSTTTSIVDTAGTSGGTISVQASNNGCLSAATSINVNVSNKPSNPTISSDTVKLCQNATASQLTATTNPSNNGGALNWYTSATGGTASTTAPTPSTTFATITTFYVSQTVNGSESDRVPIIVVVNPSPNQPNAISGNTSVTTNTTYSYSVGAVTGATSYTWTLPNGWSGTSTTNSITVTTDTLTSGIISVRANIGNCSSAAQTLRVGSLPSKPDISGNPNLVGDSIIYCQGASANALTANLNPSNNGGTLKWYTTSVGGTGSTTAPTPSTTTAGITSYFVSQTVNNIESERSEIKIIVKPTPNQPNAIQGSTNVTVNTNFTYSVGAVTGATSYTWTLPSGWSGTSTTNSININTNNVTSGTISVTANIGNCSSASQSLSLGAMPLDPDISGNTNIIGDSIVYCQNAQAIQLTARTNPANNGGTLKWYTTPTGGTASTTAPTPSTSTAGTTIYYVSQTVNGVESNRAQIRVIVKPIPNQPNAIQGNTNVTANTNFTYSVGVVSGATSYTWTIPNGWTGTSTTNSINVTTNSTTSGTISVTANLNGCSSAAQSITIGTLPSNPTSGLAGDSIVYCQNATATQLSANASTNGTLKWYTTAVGGSALSSAPTPSTSLLGTTIYYVSQTVNNVESNRTAIKVVVTNQNCATPCYTSKPVLGSNQIFNNCPATTADLTTVSASNQPVGAIVTWHTALPATASNKIANPTAVAAGAYYAVFFNAATGCFADSGRAGTSILVTITDCSKCNAGSTSPKLNTTGISNTCPVTSADLTKVTASNQPSGTVLQWHTSLPITANNKVANPSQVTAGIYYAVYFDATNNCYSNNGQGYTPVIVTISSCPNPCNAGTTAPNISNDVMSNICPATTVNLNSVTATNTPANTSISWHTGLPATASNRVANPNSVLAGIYYAVFFDTTNNCYSGAGYGSKPVVVTISNCPDPCNAGKIAPVLSADSALNVCPATTVNLNAITSNNTPSGTTLQWHTSLPATAGNKVTNPAAVVAGTYYAVFYDATNNCYSNQGFGAKQFIASTTNCGPACTAGNFSPNVDKNVIANVCPATTVNLNTITASNQPKNTTFSWHTSIPATASNKIANPQAYGSQGTVYAVFYDSKNDCYNQGGNSGTEVTVVITSCPNPCKGGTENPKLSATDITNICPASTSNLSTVTASNLPSGAVLEWHTGLPITASNKLSNTTNVNSGIYYAVFYDVTNNCYSNNGLSATQVLVANTSCPKCLVPSTAPEIPKATIATICPATTADLNTVVIINKPRGVVVRWYTAAAVSNATLVSNPSAVVAGTYYATFYDTANNCFANSGNGNFTSVTVTLTKCCNAGNEAPKFNLMTLTNICPATTVDLTAVKAINQPTNLVLEWHTATPVSASTKVKDISKVNAGTYYAVFYDATNNCYASNGQMTTPFTVSTKTCTTCNAGNSSPDLSTSAISNVCPATTVDLSKVSASNQPAGTVLEWHITSPASKNTKVEDNTKVGAGTYYAIFYDPTNTCYANNGLATAKIDVVIRNCNTPCNAGEVAPKLNTNAISNTCPSTTADLTNVSASNLPSGAVLQWHTTTPASAANKVANASQVGSGTYYAVFYDATNNCYSAVGNGTTPVTVVIGNCTNPSKCDTFKSSPTLIKDTTVNSCPSLTANLSSLASTVSLGTIVTWHTATPASDANRISNSTSVGAGTYYAVLYDTASKCYAMKGYGTKKVTVTINNCPVCNSGNEAPIVDKQSLMNNCPTATADLTSIKVSNLPKNTILTWHTATPATDANKVSNPSATSIVGTYYAAFYDPTNGCYSGAGKSTFPVQVDIVNCNTTCASGNAAPQLGATALKNICPAATADLTTISASNKPASSNVVLSWHTAIPTSEFNKVNNPSAVTSGTYYAVFYDVTNKCYAGNGKATTTVIVSIDNCSPKCNAGNAQPFFGADSLLNKCPLTTANLLTLVAQNQPKGTVVEWRNASGGVVANPSAVTAGSYTAYFKDTINNCYSSGTPNAVQVKIVSCIANGPNNDYVQFDSRSKGPKEIQTATNDTKTSGSKYSITPNGNPKKGTASIDPVTGKIIYTITDTSFVGYDTITYQLCDTITNQCSTAYVIVSLSNPKDTTVSNIDGKPEVIIPLDSVTGIPKKPNGAGQSYMIQTNPSNGTATIDSNGKLVYRPNAGACGKDSVKVSRIYSFSDGRPTEVYSYWVYIENPPCDDEIPNYISPNGDGANDKFVLPATMRKKYPNLRLSIYNRWGNMVWRSNGVYQNNWGGSHYDDSNLPDGVYYYIIELENQNEKARTGFIQVMRH